MSIINKNDTADRTSADSISPKRNKPLKKARGKDTPIMDGVVIEYGTNTLKLKPKKISDTTCKRCKLECGTKAALFDHLKEKHGFKPKHDNGYKSRGSRHNGKASTKPAKIKMPPNSVMADALKAAVKQKG